MTILTGIETEAQRMIDKVKQNILNASKRDALKKISELETFVHQKHLERDYNGPNNRYNRERETFNNQRI